MSSFKKSVKIVAYLLAVAIILGIASTIYNLFMAFVPVNDKIVVEEYSKVFKEVKKLDIDLTAASLTIKKGEEFKVEAYNLPSKLTVKQDGKKLKIKMKKTFTNIHVGDIIITIPDKIDDFSLDAGAGSISITDLEADSADINLGAGKASFENVKFNEADIDGGAGKTTIIKSDIRDLDLDAGAGALHVSAYLRGSNKISCGVGQVSITLLGDEDDYKVKAKRGLGSLTINGRNYGDEVSYGNGKNKVSIDGGVGEIIVRFK